eukprot:11653884-Alexandrium_andersonii.AAC.1
MATWHYLMQELGLMQVQGSLVWTLDAGDTQHPRKKGGSGYDLDMNAPADSRAHAIRNAWRSKCWCNWRDHSLRYDAGLA